MRALPKTASIGKDVKGRFRTASLKEYPSALSHALWNIVDNHIQMRGFVDVPQDCPEDVLSKVRALVAQLDFSVQEMGPDFNPAARIN